MLIPAVTKSIINTGVASNQDVNVTITVSGLSQFSHKMVHLSVQFTSRLNSKTEYFSKLVDMDLDTVDFTITVPYPTGITPANIVISDIIYDATAEYYFIE